MDDEIYQHLILKGVKSVINNREVGRGAYDRVYVVRYCETLCVAKEIHPILVNEVQEAEMVWMVQSFLKECRQCSTLCHPNVIQFLGIYYPAAAVLNPRIQLPVMVMELMASSLTSFMQKFQKILKLSIIQDVSLGLCYLHSHDPPIIHRDLSPNNILLTEYHKAKISDLGVAKVIGADSRKTMTKTPGTVDFMPPESLNEFPDYGTPMDIFSFAGIILHIFCQQWPTPSKHILFDPITRKRVALSEVERRQQYLDRMSGEGGALRPLVEECLDDDPVVRPTIATICRRIQSSRETHLTEPPLDMITLHQINEDMRATLEQQRAEIKQLRATLGQMESLDTFESLHMQTSNMQQYDKEAIRERSSSVLKMVS